LIAANYERELNMSTDGLNDTKKEEQAFYALAKAVREDNFEAIDEMLNDTPEPQTPENPIVDPEVEPVVPTPEDHEAIPAEPEVPAGEADPNAPVVPETPDESVEARLAALQAKLDAALNENHRYKSDAGRVPSLQKRMAELEKRLNPSKDGTQTPDSSKSDVFDDESKRVLAELRENDPVMADHMEKLLGSTTGKLRQQFDQRLREADQAELEQISDDLERAEYDRLITMAPYAPQVFKSPQWDAWKKQLRPADRAYAESSNADEVNAAIQWFGRDLQALADQQKGNTPNAQPQPQATPPVVASTPKPKAAPVVKGGLAAQSGGKALTEEEMYSQLWKEIGERDQLDTPTLR